MPSGNVHDTVNTVALTGYVAYSVATQQTDWLPTAVGIAVGTLWLSPDLDLKSEPYYRHGPLRVLWMPYVKIMPHRSIWSHGLIIGDLIRLLYSAAFVIPLLFLALYLKLVESSTVDSWFAAMPAFIIGVMIASTIHIVLDHSSSFFRTKKKRKKRR
ncbi:MULTISPECIES: metal-binding protein [Exiguobacterium]|uniref:metal-binding protein n=1 Tax=Exiguobacterium TaxID=33986 RepID=UPI001BE94B6C|nr:MULTISPECIES: metal-binding protein [Exiguobacterium]MCT4792830.1 metal-binding protein [Exiguobacterium artemiae]